MSEPQVAKYSMRLDWKEFNLDLNAVEAWMRANAGEQYCGNQAHSCLELWFLEEPSQESKDAIEAYWDALTEESEEATAYESNEERQEAIAALKASAKAKLIAGTPLSEAEATAILG